VALIQERVAQARAGTNPKVLCRTMSGWAVMGDVQFLPGYCLLLADPVVASLNDLSADERIRFLSEMTLIGDALLEVTGASRINYEILGNAEPELHAHIFPRFRDEPDHLIRRPAWFYDRKAAPQFSEEMHGHLKQRITEAIQKRIKPSP
jgi:diadenosine tetraphosphate (Ap4A) HIT family hydrolase